MLHFLYSEKLYRSQAVLFQAHVTVYISLSSERNKVSSAVFKPLVKSSAISPEGVK